MPTPSCLRMTLVTLAHDAANDAMGDNATRVQRVQRHQERYEASTEREEVYAQGQQGGKGGSWALRRGDRSR